MKDYTSILMLLLVCSFEMAAQKFQYAIPGLDTIEKNFIVGGGASQVLRAGEGEIIINNALVSHWLAFHQNGDDSPVLDRFRQTFFATDVFGYYGLSQSGKLDVGLQLRYARTRLDNAAGSSMLKVFEKTEEDPLLRAPTDEGATIIDSSFGGISLVGLRFRFKPILSSPEFVINGGIALSMVRDDRLMKQLDAETDVFDVGATYYKSISSRVYYFFGGTMQVLLPTIQAKKALYQGTLNFFLIHRSRNQKLTFLPGLSYSMRFKSSVFDSHSLIKSNEFLFAMLGVQYGFNQNVMVFGNLGFPLIADAIPPQIEIVRESYSLLSLGARVAF